MPGPCFVLRETSNVILCAFDVVERATDGQAASVEDTFALLSTGVGVDHLGGGSDVLVHG